MSCWFVAHTAMANLELRLATAVAEREAAQKDVRERAAAAESAAAAAVAEKKGMVSKHSSGGPPRS